MLFIFFNKIALSTSFKFSSLSGKCSPISPKPKAPIIASVIACKSTSPSECPKTPFV